MQRLGTILLISAVVALGTTASNSSRADVGEYELKAEMVIRFPDFVDWPTEEVPGDSGEPLILGILGTDPLAGRLARAVEKGPRRSIELRELETPEEMGECHMVYVGESETERLSGVVERAEREHVLTVGDTEGFAERGIHINLYLTEGRVGFEVNREAAAASRLRLSSKLLRLARLVEGPDS